MKTQIIKNHTSIQNEENKIIENNLSEQKDKLMKRLEERRMKMKKPVVKDNERQHLTNSSTPNFPLSSKKEGGGSSEKSLEKNDPSSDNSFDEN